MAAPQFRETLMSFAKIAAALEIYNSANGPNLSVEEVAERVHMSASNFTRTFRALAGVSPNRYSQYLQAIRIGSALQRAPRCQLGALRAKLGLKSASSIYDHSYKVLALSPQQLHQQGQGADISYGSADTPFGVAHIFTSDHGICRLSFAASLAEEVEHMSTRWPRARLHQDPAAAEAWGEKLFLARAEHIPLHLLGTNFQLSVWQALLRIDTRSLSNYSDIAAFIGNPKAVRAVGQAVGANPIAWLIPCHRVIRAGGELGGYHWGLARKQSMLAWEQAASAEHEYGELAG